MSEEGKYPLIEVRIRGEAAPRWQLETARQLQEAWPGGVRLRMISGLPPRRRSWLARFLTELELKSVLGSGLLVESARPEVTPGLVLDLSGDGQAVRHPISDGCARIWLRSLGGDLSTQALPFAAEIAAGANTTSVFVEISPCDGLHWHGAIELGCWRTVPERYIAFADSVLRDLPKAVFRALTQQTRRSGSPQEYPRTATKSLGAKRSLALRLAGSVTVIVGMARGLVVRLWNNLFRHEQWTIGIMESKIQAFLSPGARAPIRWLPACSRAEYLADPFGVNLGRDSLVYAERFDYRLGKGRIVMLSLDVASGSPTEYDSLELNTHLSYPYIFQAENRLMGVPENFESNSIRLYDVDMGYPSEWRNPRNLVSGFAGVDATIFQWDGRWWMFATGRDEGPDSHLHAWYAESVEGPWRSHRLNPIKIDVRGSRPGGTPFFKDGRLFRPAQDCSLTYGGRVVINEIRQLDDETFEETPVAFVEPDPESPWRDGLHTLSAFGENATLLDAKRTVFSPWACWGAIRGIAKKLLGVRR